MHVGACVQAARQAGKCARVRAVCLCAQMRSPRSVTRPHVASKNLSEAFVFGDTKYTHGHARQCLGALLEPCLECLLGLFAASLWHGVMELLDNLLPDGIIRTCRGYAGVCSQTVA